MSYYMPSMSSNDQCVRCDGGVSGALTNSHHIVVGCLLMIPILFNALLVIFFENFNQWYVFSCSVTEIMDSSKKTISLYLEENIGKNFTKIFKKAHKVCWFSPMILIHSKSLPVEFYWDYPFFKYRGGLSIRKLRGILGLFSQSLCNYRLQSWCFN